MRPLQKAHDLYLRAQRLLLERKPEAAVDALQGAITAFPLHDPSLELLFGICRPRGWREPWREGLRSAHRGGNENPQVLTTLLMMALEEGHHQEARDLLDEFRSLHPRRRKIGRFRISELERYFDLIRPADRAARERRPAPAERPKKARPSPRAERVTPPSPRAKSTRPPSRTPGAARSGKAAPGPPAAERPVLARPAPTELPLRIEMEPSPIFDRLAAEHDDGLDRYRLGLAAHRLARANTMDQLLCLPALRGVEQLWYQIETVRKVLRRFRGRALLSDEVGLGKTVEAGMIVKEYLMRGLVRSVLVLVPPSLVGQWKEEMAAKFGLDFATTNDRLRKADPGAFWAGRDLVIASLALVSRERNLEATSRTYDLIVVDEAHHLRNRATRAWKYVNGLKSRFLLLLTATPLHNNLSELHNLITLLKPGQLQTHAAFVREFVSKQDPTRPVNEEKLRRLLSEVMIRNTRALAALRLPPRHASTLRVPPSPRERELYEGVSTLVRTLYASGNGAGGNGAVDRLTLRLLQTEAGSSAAALAATLEKLLAAGSLTPGDAGPLVALARSINGASKVEALAEHLGRGREPAIVFVGYRATAAAVEEALRKRGVETTLFHGGLTAAEKDAAVDRFRGGTPVLLSTDVGGEGRNLQFCHRLVNFDLPWNPMRIEQRIGRIHRIGQDKEVEILNLCAAGSVEDHLLEILDKKINLFELTVGEVDMILGKLEDRRDFPEKVFEAWAGAPSATEAAENFARLSDELQSARAGYERVKALDETLFGSDYEV